MARVLVVDNYEGFRQAMAFCLPTFGHRVVACQTREVTSGFLAEAQPEIAVVGVSPASLDGFGICEWLRREPRWQSLPFVVLSNPLTPAIENRGKALGAAAILANPFNWSELLGVLDRETRPCA